MKHMDSGKFAHLDQLKRTDVEKWAGRVIYETTNAAHPYGQGSIAPEHFAPYSKNPTLILTSIVKTTQNSKETQ